MWVKVCGITNGDDAELALRRGAHALGFIFVDSPRRIDRAEARAIVRSIPHFVTAVGVFVDARLEDVVDIVCDCDLDVAQLHGSETPAFMGRLPVPCFKALSSHPPLDAKTVREFAEQARGNTVLIDMPKGERKRETTWPRHLEEVRKHRQAGIILAGGLNPDNLVDALDIVEPHAIDVASGVEREPGRKDPDKVHLFFEQIESWKRNR